MRHHTTRACTHRWLLEEPGPRTVRGFCRRCGARRTYRTGGDILAVQDVAQALDTPLVPIASFEDEPAERVALGLSAVDRYGSVAAERC